MQTASSSHLTVSSNTAHDLPQRASRSCLRHLTASNLIYGGADKATPKPHLKDATRACEDPNDDAKHDPKQIPSCNNPMIINELYAFLRLSISSSAGTSEILTAGMGLLADLGLAHARHAGP